VSTVVLDLDGVVYRGESALPGAGAALAELDRDHRVVLATNNSSRTPEQVVAKIERLTGIALDPALAVTSAMAAASIADAVPTTVVGGPGIDDALGRNGIPIVDAADAAQLITGIDFAFDYDRLRGAARCARRGARWISTNDDVTFPAEDGLWPGAGAITAAVAAASGVEPEVAGKPHPPMARLLGELADDGPVIVVGDRPETDLALARTGGWLAVLALSGVTDSAQGLPESLAPDHVVAGLADVPVLLERIVA
jgi:4-nitrophenyl phosphatase